MADRCCACPGGGYGSAGSPVKGLPLICLVPREEASGSKPLADGGNSNQIHPGSGNSAMKNDFQFLDDDYIKKHFNLPKRALYLDPFRRPLITFPIGGEKTKNFNMARKDKINQMILDGFLDPSEAISAPSVFPYGKTEAEKRNEAEAEEEVIYILQLPDWEFQCPIHNKTIRTPRFIWHSCKKSKKDDGEMKQGGGPLNRPKPWILARHTDFDMASQW